MSNERVPLQVRSLTYISYRSDTPFCVSIAVPLVPVVFGFGKPFTLMCCQIQYGAMLDLIACGFERMASGKCAYPALTIIVSNAFDRELTQFLSP